MAVQMNCGVVWCSLQTKVFLLNETFKGKGLFSVVLFVVIVLKACAISTDLSAIPPAKLSIINAIEQLEIVECDVPLTYENETGVLIVFVVVRCSRL